MKYSIFVGSMATWICLGLAAPLLAAQPPPSGMANVPSAGEAANPAEKCLNDLHTLDSRMQTDGYWQSPYPIGGFEVRGLVFTVNTLAQHGEQQLCEDMLSTARDTYNRYLADMHSRVSAAGERTRLAAADQHRVTGE